MRYGLALVVICLAGCGEVDFLPDEKLLPMFPSSMNIPSCASVDLSERSWTNHTRRDSGYEEYLRFKGSRTCMNSWARSLGKTSSDRGEMFFREKFSEYEAVMRPGGKRGQEGKEMSIRWSHPDPLDEVEYTDMRRD